MTTFLKELWLNLKTLRYLRRDLLEIKKQHREMLNILKELNELVRKNTRAQIALREVVTPGVRKI